MRISVVAIILLALGSATPALAMSCTQRHKVCLNVCATQYSKNPGCTRFCGDALPQCMSSGCWKTPQANKCGYTKS